MNMKKSALGTFVEENPAKRNTQSGYQLWHIILVGIVSLIIGALVKQ
jgi:hypothetical protein